MHIISDKFTNILESQTFFLIHFLFMFLLLLYMFSEYKRDIYTHGKRGNQREKIIITKKFKIMQDTKSKRIKC